MINMGFADNERDAARFKSIAKTLLAAIVEQERGEPEVTSTGDGRCEDRRWKLDGCDRCMVVRHTHLADDDSGYQARFCPSCWELDLHDRSGERVAHASRILQKRTQDLPEGAEVTALTIGGKEVWRRGEGGSDG
jgi:hypothetical protein